MIIRIIIFISIFLSLYGLMHWYIMARLANLFSLPRNAFFYGIVALSTLSFVIAHLLESHVCAWYAKIFNIIASLWMGCALILFGILISYEIIRIFIKIPPVTAGIIIVGLALLLSVYAVINALFINVKTIEIQSHKVSRDFTIALISDIHYSSPHFTSVVYDIVKKINEQHPDIICIAGDFFDDPLRFNDTDYHLFQQLSAPVYFVFGNHEHYVGIEKVKNILQKLPFKLLHNEAVVDDGFQIIGIDDTESVRDMEKELNNIAIDNTKYSILLSHRPQGMRLCEKKGIDLMLCGHLHAGQIFPFNLFVLLMYRPMYGLHSFGASHVYISPGTSTWGPPMRLGSRNEITIIKVKRTR